MFVAEAESFIVPDVVSLVGHDRRPLLEQQVLQLKNAESNRQQYDEKREQPASHRFYLGVPTHIN